MEVIRNFIKEKKPSLSKSSVTTYSSILKSLYKNVFGDNDISMDKFKETKKILDYLNDIPANKRKTILSSLVIVTNDKKYRDLMLEDIKTYNENTNKQEKTDSQKDSWVDTNQVETILEELKNNANIIYKKKNLTVSDLQDIQNYIILCLLSGYYIPPRRSKDYCDFKIKNVSKNDDNYLDKDKLIFNSYKTAKTYGTQMVEIPKDLKAILNKWIKINPTEYLLFDSQLNKLSSVKLNQRLNKIFSLKKVGVNQLRHTYLTNKYKATIDQNKEINDTMNEMGSSAQQLTTYVKK